ncbi:hypothetical protein ACJA3S_01570 [Pseudomonas sp. KnCO4]|uniref:hypothetical protein n=1 Tax=Pseudomonas sp. KnCO4 TaxID=3381355 RepID=UPI003877B7C3
MNVTFRFGTDPITFNDIITSDLLHIRTGDGIVVYEMAFPYEYPKVSHIVEGSDLVVQFSENQSRQGKPRTIATTRLTKEVNRFLVLDMYGKAQEVITDQNVISFLIHIPANSDFEWNGKRLHLNEKFLFIEKIPNVCWWTFNTTVL